ncbi:MAG: alpha/beta fold hydrolase [Desulfobacteraceae bacterium]|nr:alpha/beta fold hydrolase [Desulfobacteraceae bacterium]
MPSILDIHFKSDNYLLKGTLHLPDTANAPIVIGCHGLMADRQSPKQIALAEACNKDNIAYFRFDHRGCGDSQGDFNTVTTLAARVKDLQQAILQMRSHPKIGKLIGLFGSSFGGTVVLATGSITDVPSIITYAAPVSSLAINRTVLQEDTSDQPLPVNAKTKLNFNLVKDLKNVSNILIIHGEKDKLVPLEQAHLIYRHTRDPKKLIIQTKGDHRMSNRGHQINFVKQSVHWFKACLAISK